MLDPLLSSRSCSRRKSVFSFLRIAANPSFQCVCRIRVRARQTKTVSIASAAMSAGPLELSPLLLSRAACSLVRGPVSPRAQARSSNRSTTCSSGRWHRAPDSAGRRGLDHEVCEGCSRVPFARLLRSSPTGRARHLLVPDERCPVPALRTNKRPPSRLRQT